MSLKEYVIQELPLATLLYDWKSIDYKQSCGGKDTKIN